LNLIIPGPKILGQEKQKRENDKPKQSFFHLNDFRKPKIQNPFILPFNFVRLKKR
jgi:hypothetical protein